MATRVYNQEALEAAYRSLEVRKVIYIEDVQRQNKTAGLHFFDADTLRFFRSRIDWQTFGTLPIIYFVTSEKFTMIGYPDGPRLYTVRAIDMRTGRTLAVSEFQRFKTLQGARNHAKKLASLPYDGEPV